jgi:hypothetical protein
VKSVLSWSGRTAAACCLAAWAAFLPGRELAVELPPALLNASDAALACADDATRLDPADAEYTRYLVLPNRTTRKARLDDYRVAANHVNSLSDQQRMALPRPVSGTGMAVLAVDLRDYGWRKETWEKLGTFDPYFHTPVQVEEVVKVRKKYLKSHTNAWWRRKTSEDEWERCEGGDDEYYEVVDTASKPALALAPWLSDPFPGRSTPGDPARERRLGDLVKATRSASPLLAFHWFFRQTAIQDDDKYDGKCPGYYDFLKVGDRQEDFERQFALDLDTARFVFQAEMFAAVGRSSVANNNRRILRWDAIGGGWYATLDVRQSVDKRNFLTNFDDLDIRKGFKNTTGKRGFAQIAASKIVVFDASEQFRPLPNKLMVWFLSNARGERQNSVPDFLATDKTAPGTDQRVWNNLSCVRCHLDGIKPVDDWVRNVSRAPLAFHVKDPAAARRQAQLYGEGLEDAIAGDQAVYKRAVWRSTCTPGNRDGLSTKEFNSLYREFWSEYQEESFDLDRIALWTGLDRKAVLYALDGLVKKVGSTNPVLAGLLRAVADGEKEAGIRSEMFEEVFPTLMLSLKGYQPVLPRPD